MAVFGGKALRSVPGKFTEYAIRRSAEMAQKGIVGFKPASKLEGVSEQSIDDGRSTQGPCYQNLRRLSVRGTR